MVTSMSRKGIPNFKPTPEQREQVEMLAAIGTPHEHIVLVVKNDGTPISVDTLTRHFVDELAGGLAKANSLVAGKLMRTALGRNEKATAADELRAQMFWLNTRGGFDHRNRVIEETPEDDELDDVAVAARIAGIMERGRRKAGAKTH